MKNVFAYLIGFSLFFHWQNLDARDNALHRTDMVEGVEAVFKKNQCKRKHKCKRRCHRACKGATGATGATGAAGPTGAAGAAGIGGIIYESLVLNAFSAFSFNENYPPTNIDLPYAPTNASSPLFTVRLNGWRAPTRYPNEPIVFEFNVPEDFDPSVSPTLKIYFVTINPGHSATAGDVVLDTYYNFNPTNTEIAILPTTLPMIVAKTSGGIVQPAPVNQSYTYSVSGMLDGTIAAGDFAFVAILRVLPTSPTMDYSDDIFITGIEFRYKTVETIAAGGSR